jgi:hypothetical protein
MERWAGGSSRSACKAAIQGPEYQALDQFRYDNYAKDRRRRTFLSPFQSTSDSLNCERLVISPSTRSDMASTSFCSCSALTSSSEEGGDDVEVDVVEDEDGGPMRTRMRFLVVAEIPNFLSASLIWGCGAIWVRGGVTDPNYQHFVLSCFQISGKRRV